MRLSGREIKTSILLIFIIGWQGCSYLRKSEFLTIMPADLTSIVETLSENEKRVLAQNESRRKSIIDNYKQVFSLAQAAEQESVDRSDKYKKQLSLRLEQLLSSIYLSRNQNVTISKEEREAYYTSHKDAIESDFQFFAENSKKPISDKQKESFNSQWSEIKIRADKARQAGLERDPLVVARLKFMRAEILASLYSERLREQYKPTQEEKNKYLAEHPDADPEKLRQKAQGLLDRIKNGEKFEKIANEFTDDPSGRGSGGELGWFGKGIMDPVFEQAAFALGKGQLTGELVKTDFGYHIIRVDDKRTTSLKSPAPATGQQQVVEPNEEIRARHILVDTRKAESYEENLVQEKLKRAREETTLKYPVKTPDDFPVKVEGQEK
ncbi:MAG: peptidylprolyl isomerase [Acidobacteria bacterium]|nr:peptidylprolyl isomerase [Acidobacteriota bacterium]